MPKIGGGGFARFDTRGSGGFPDTGLPVSNKVAWGNFARFDTRGSGGFPDTGIPLTSSKSQALEPFLAFRTRYDQAMERIRNPPGAVETAILCWGGSPRDPLAAASGGGGFSTRDPEDKPKKDKDDVDNRRILRVRNRWVERVEVASEDDPDIVLITERVRLLVANGNDGMLWFIECKPDGKKTTIKKGSTLPPEAFR